MLGNNLDLGIYLVSIGMSLFMYSSRLQHQGMPSFPLLALKHLPPSHFPALRGSPLITVGESERTVPPWSECSLFSYWIFRYYFMWVLLLYHFLYSLFSVVFYMLLVLLHVIVFFILSVWLPVSLHAISGTVHLIYLVELRDYYHFMLVVVTVDSGLVLDIMYCDLIWSVDLLHIWG